MTQVQVSSLFAVPACMHLLILAVSGDAWYCKQYLAMFCLVHKLSNYGVYVYDSDNNNSLCICLHNKADP